MCQALSRKISTRILLTKFRCDRQQPRGQEGEENDGGGGAGGDGPHGGEQRRYPQGDPPGQRPRQGADNLGRDQDGAGPEADPSPATPVKVGCSL